MEYQDALKKVHDKEWSPDDLHHFLSEKAQGISREIPILHACQLPLYRARIFKEERFQKLSELSYNSECSSSRANREGLCYFYCSMNIHTVLSEAMRDMEFESGSKKAKIIISKWNTSEKLYLQDAGFQSNPFENFCREIFMIPGKEYYKYTAEIAYFLTYSKEDEVGQLNLMYPSVEKNSAGKNVAIKSKFVDQFLDFHHAFILDVEMFMNGDVNAREIDFVTSNDGVELNWKGRARRVVLREKGGRLKCRYDGNEWICTNGEGELVDFK